MEGFSKKHAPKSKEKIIDKFKMQGVNAAAAKRFSEFKMPDNKETKETKNKKGNVIRDKYVVISIFPATESNPGAKSNVAQGIKSSIITTKINKT